MIAVTAAVKLAEYAWDKANTTVEEVTERIDELSDSISTLESEYNSLREAGSENLTDAELARLDYLEDRIAREKELKELEEARLIREKYGNKFTDYFDEDNYNSKYNDFRETYFDGMSKIDVTSLGYGIDQNNQAVIDIGSKVDEYNTISEEIQTYIAQMKLLDPNSQEYIQLDDYKNARENELNSLIPDLQTEYQNYKAAKYEAETAIEEMTADLNNPNLTDRDKEVIQGWISEYENAIKIADYYIGLMKGIPAVPVYKDTESYANWFGTLSDAEKEITTSDEFTQAIEEQKDKLDGAILSVEDYTKALQSAKDALGFDDETTDLWDYSDTITQLDTIKDKFDTLDKTYSKLFDSDKQIGFEDYSSISEAFKDVSDIESYIQRLQEAGQNQEEVTAVMEDLISAYLDYTGLLDNVTEENASLIEQTLTELGVLNSKELVLARLSGELINMSNAEEIATTHGLTLTDITWEEINALVVEGSISFTKKNVQLCTRSFKKLSRLFSIFLLHHLLHHFGVKIRETITTYVKLLTVPKSS